MILKTRGSSALVQFYDALTATGQQHLATLLETSPTIIAVKGQLTSQRLENKF